jgi:hypothetical protein
MDYKFGILGAVVAIAASLAGVSAAQTQQRLAQIDQTFVCPETLPSDDARKAALNLFLDEVAAVQPTITLKQVLDFRVALLRKHQCRATLANLGIAPEEVASPTSLGDHWERAGAITGPHGMAVSIDMDSMTSAGPGKLRVWIKYHFDGVGPKNVKESLVYEQLDCARKYHSTISLYSYAPDGHVVLSEKGNADDEEPIIPDSILDRMLPFTCAAHGLNVGR